MTKLETLYVDDIRLKLEWCVFVPRETRKVIYQAFLLPQGYYPFSLLKYVAYRNLHHNFSAKFAKKNCRKKKGRKFPQWSDFTCLDFRFLG